jgi:rhamnopyranosyl-N-acetylglucosaminyl-diphospho-decaprenol beta-1,3/1,4-galactofuranosyltransferase
MSRVCAVVVTYNRKDLLAECLDAVGAQTRPVEHVLVVDNASTDGTRELLDARDVEVLRLAQNEGSSGGFHAGMSEAASRDFEWLWVMDDDTIPAPDALAELFDAMDRLDGLPEPSLLASKVVWTDDKVHPMNPPAPHPRDMDLFLDAVERGVVPIRSNTFPSLLVRTGAVRRHGAPRKGFWIWSDDIDFTQRILRDEVGYVVPQSVALHKTKTAHAPWHGGERFYYAVRNGLFILRGDTLEPQEKIGWTYIVGMQIGRFLSVERFRPGALRIVLRGLRDGVLKPRP